MAPPGTITCFLCGGTHIFPGPRFEAHLQNEHGAIFDIEFLISVSQYKQLHHNLPDINSEASVAATPPRSVQGEDRPPGVEVTTQTPGDSRRQMEDLDLTCTKCHEPLDDSQALISQSDIKDEPKEDILGSSFTGIQAASSIREAINMAKNSNKVGLDLGDDMRSDDDSDDDDVETASLGHDLNMELPRHFMSVSPRGAGSDMTEGSQEVWQCSFCSMVYKRHSYFKQHMTIAHEVSQEDVAAMQSVLMTEEEFLRKQNSAEKEREEEGLISPRTAAAYLADGSPSPCYAVDKAKRKVVGKEWAPNSFSSRFTCMFCSEQFRKDYKLKLHLMMDHKDQPKELMDKAKEELVKAKLDGCVHMCKICRNKYNSIANFTRHIKDVHQMSRNEYKEQYGDSEVVSRMFTCELCQKEVKHTRNIIGAHMKMVHLISWKEYQDIVLKLRSGDENISLPNPELFDCVICGVSVKYKREHLNKKHQLDEDVYEALIAKKARGEDISEDLPEREVYTCAICERECMDFKRHLQVCHKLTEEQYMEEFCNGEMPQVKIVKQDVFKEDPNFGSDLPNESPRQGANKSASTPVSSAKKKKVKKEKADDAETCATDLRCYFDCDEVFKKDYQLHLHLKLRHRNEEPEELEKAYEAANEEIALTRRSASLFNCALCPKVFNDNGAFYGHIQNKHDITYREYKERFGRCETESQPFECKICGKVIKYDRNTVHTHLKNVHGINWEKYLNRIRKLRRGQEPDPLPAMKMVECRVCNISVKYLKEHLRNAHKITEKEYRELFSDDKDATSEIPQMFAETGLAKPKSAKISKRVPSFASSGPSEADMETDIRGDEGSFKSERESPLPVVTPVEVTLPTNIDLKKERPPKEDIQNKLNKYCSVCQIDFESRKSFIEHCQVVHGMKFKTKSGISIPPPTNPGVGVKRKFSDTDAETEVRRPVSEIQLEGTPSIAEYQEQWTGDTAQDPLRRQSVTSFDSHPGELVIAELDSSAEAGAAPRTASYGKDKPDPWNRCQFQCRLCDVIFTDRRNVKSHIVMAHKLSYQDYLAQYGDPELPTAKWQCLMCGSETRHARNNIYIHLRDCHSMTCDQYAAQHGMPGMEKTEDGSFSWPGDHQLTSGAQHQVTGGQTEQAGNTGVVSTQFSSKWNKCKFQCPVCDKVSNEKRHIRTHTMSAHGMSLDVLEAENGDCEFHTEYFFCAVCHAEVKHCHRNILMHLQRSHNLTCAEYEAKYGDVDTGASSAPVEEAGIGQHFLITDGGGNLLGGQARSQASPVMNKPRKSLGGSQARNVSDSGRLIRGTGNIPCENCNRMFSTHSNKERHKREHCSNMQLANMTKAGLVMGHNVDTGHSPVKKEEDVKEELRCWVEGCGEEFVRSVHLKRHLTGTHNIQNPLMEARSMVVVKAEVEEEKVVPPLKIKLNQNDSDKSEEENIGHDEDMRADDDELMEDEIMDNVEIIDANSISDHMKSEENAEIGIVIDESNTSPIADEEEPSISERDFVSNIIEET